MPHCGHSRIQDAFDLFGQIISRQCFKDSKLEKYIHSKRKLDIYTKACLIRQKKLWNIEIVCLWWCSFWRGKPAKMKLDIQAWCLPLVSPGIWNKFLLWQRGGSTGFVLSSHSQWIYLNLKEFGFKAPVVWGYLFLVENKFYLFIDLFLFYFREGEGERE